MTKNKLVDKTGHFRQMFEDSATGAFSFQEGNASWVRKRKAYSHAFHNFKVDNMIEVLKDKLGDFVEELNAEIDASEDG